MNKEMNTCSVLQRNLSSETIGWYWPNGFFITLTPSVNCLDFNNKILKITDEYQLGTFGHEYWHFLQNVSTISGFLDLLLAYCFLSPFSCSMLPQADGTSNGSAMLEKQMRLRVEKMGRYFSALQGGSRVSLAIDLPIIDMVVLEAEPEEKPIPWINNQGSITPVSLYLKVNLGCMGEELCGFRLGTLAIQEGICNELEAILKGSDIKNSGSAPLVPYKILRKLGEFICRRDLTSLEVASVGTLALLTREPALKVLELFGVLKSLPTTSSLKCLKDNLFPLIEADFNATFALLPSHIQSLMEITKGRAPLDHAIKTILEFCERQINRRKIDPLFDLAYILESSTPREGLFKLLSEIPPCDVMQLNDPNPGDNGAEIASFWPSADSWTSETIRVLQAQMHFLSHHLDSISYLFKPSSKVNASCPFYPACNVGERLKNPKICREKPWTVFKGGNADLCWYGIGVSATISTQKVKKV